MIRYLVLTCQYYFRIKGVSLMSNKLHRKTLVIKNFYTKAFRLSIPMKMGCAFEPIPILDWDEPDPIRDVCPTCVVCGQASMFQDVFFQAPLLFLHFLANRKAYIDRRMKLMAFHIETIPHQ